MALDSQNNCEAWPIDTTAGCWDIPATVTPETILLWQQVATQYLWSRTGRRLGPSCPLTVRPCRKSCLDGYGFGGRYLNQGQYLSTGGFIPYMAGGLMYNATVCGCGVDCQCGAELCEIRLPGPVYDIVEVKIDGVAVDPITYHVYDAQFLTRINSIVDDVETARCWPSCQDLTLRDSQPNTFAVTYRTGLNLSALATMAVTELTAHLIRGCNGGCGCGSGTKQNLARLSRQGVDLEFVDPTTALGEGLTGIEVVDWFIASANPYGVASPMRVLSPDAPRRPRIWTGGGA